MRKAGGEVEVTNIGILISHEPLSSGMSVKITIISYKFKGNFFVAIEEQNIGIENQGNKNE